MSGTAKKKLKWGETPWDAMPKKRLVREMARCFAAMTSAAGALAMLEGPDKGRGYFKRGGRGADGGSGGAALDECEIVRERVERIWDRESVFRSYFRYAKDLLFSPALGFGWHVCDTCDEMIGRQGPHQPAPQCRCKKPMRPLTWADLEPRP